MGGRLVRRLEANGRRVRCLARNPGALAGRVGPGTEVVAGDLMNPASLPAALAGVSTAFYLVHSMTSGAAFEDLDRLAAKNFADAARAAGVQRVIYLGGLGDDDAGLSSHLRSRHEIGDILKTFGGPVLEFRAAVVLGSGSLSFEMIRALVERLPVMVTPRWVKVRTQPIGIEDLLSYLALAVDAPLDASRIVEIGGANVVSYADMMDAYARQRGLRRLMIPVPVLTPRLSGLWLGLVTPIYARVGRALIASIQNETIVRHPDGARAFAVTPVGMDAAIRRAMIFEDRAFAETRWCDAVSSARSARPPAAAAAAPNARIVDARSVRVAAPPAAAFRAVSSIGGKTGWHFGNIFWRIRGSADLLIGGPGLRRGRRHPEDLRVGEPLDFWRVETFTPPELLRLRAEMKLPGRAWLQFEVKPDGAGSVITQTAVFDPRGVSGLLYWYGLYPIHALIFQGMLRGVARAAVSASL